MSRLFKQTLLPAAASHVLANDVARPRASRAALLAILAAAGIVTGCRDKVTISGDVEGLDTLALRGDSLLAGIDRAPLVEDSLRAVGAAQVKRQIAESMAAIDPAARAALQAERTKAGGDTGAAARVAAAAERAVAGMTPAGAMSRRAQARGDSMARALAARLTGGVSGADRARGDSLRGTLIWQGEGPTRSVVLRTAATTVALSGMATTGMGKLVGSEVVVHGVRISPRDLVVSDYLVRAADGVSAYDGTLLENGALRLTDGTGVKRVPVPSALRGLTGARVWIAVKDGKANAYGIITTR